MRKRWLVCSTALAFAGLVACQSPPVIPPVTGLPSSQEVVVSSQAGATIQLRVLPAAALRTQAAKTFANVTSFSVKLVRKSDDAVIATIPSLAPNLSGSVATFSNVTTGTTYVLDVDAFEGATSIAKTSPTRSADINVATTGTHSVSVNVPLKDETGGALPFQITPPSYFAGSVTFQVWLVNQATDVVVAQPTVTVPAAATTSKTLRDLSDGTYTVWAAARDASVSAPAKKCGALTIAGGTTTSLTDAGGTPVATLIPSFASSVTQVGSVPGADLRGIALNVAGVPYVASSGAGFHAVFRMPGGAPEAYVGNGTNGNGAEGAPRTGAVVINPRACAVDANGDVFVAESNGDKLRIVPQAGAASYGYPGAFVADSIYTLKSDSNEIGAVVQAVAVAPSGELYYHDGINVRRQSPAGGAFTALGTLSTSPKGMTTDRFGNLYAVAGTQVSMYVVRSGTYFGRSMTAPGWQSVTTRSGDLRGVAVDAVGNAYVTSDAGLLWMIDATDSTKVYQVAGGGGSAIANGLAPTQATIPTIWGVGVQTPGKLFFSSDSAVWEL